MKFNVSNLKNQTISYQHQYLYLNWMLEILEMCNYQIPISIDYLEIVNLVKFENKIKSRKKISFCYYLKKNYCLKRNISNILYLFIPYINVKKN